MSLVLCTRLRPTVGLRPPPHATLAVRTVHSSHPRTPRPSSPAAAVPQGQPATARAPLHAPSKRHDPLSPSPRPPPEYAAPPPSADPAPVAVSGPAPPRGPRVPEDLQERLVPASPAAPPSCSTEAPPQPPTSLIPLALAADELPSAAAPTLSIVPLNRIYQSVTGVVPQMLASWLGRLRTAAEQCVPRVLRAQGEGGALLHTVRERQARARAAETLAAVLARHALPPTAGRAEALAALAAVRAHPTKADAATVLRAAEAFREDNVLLSLPRSALIALAQYLSLASTGSLSLTQAAETAAALGLSLDGYLRFLVRRRVAALQGDDQLLHSTSLPRGGQALRAVARMRGMDLLPRRRTRRGQLRTALGEWVALHAEQRVAPTLLLLALAVSSARAPALPTHLPGFAAYLHTLLVHTPGGLDAPPRSLF